MRSLSPNLLTVGSAKDFKESSFSKQGKSKIDKSRTEIMMSMNNIEKLKDIDPGVLIKQYFGMQESRGGRMSEVNKKKKLRFIDKVSVG